VGAIRLDASINGNWDIFGFSGNLLLDGLDELVDPNAPADVLPNLAVVLGDNAFAWVKPWKFLELSFGKRFDPVFRGKVGQDTDFHLYTVGSFGGDAIFKEAAGYGFEAIVTPIAGLRISTLFPGKGGHLVPFLTEAEDIYKNIQVGVGYEIARIGHVRAQYIGGNTVEDIRSTPLSPSPFGSYLATAHRAEAAFAYTGLEGLVVDLGVQIPFPVTGDFSDGKTTWTDPFGIGLGTSFRAGAFNIAALVKADIGGSVTVEDQDKIEKGFGINIHATPAYNFGFATIGADLGFAVNPKITQGNMTHDEGGTEFGAGVWIAKVFGLQAGFVSLKTGVGITVPTVAHKVPVVGEIKNDRIITVPIILEFAGF
jgi:hypothetical protein